MKELPDPFRAAFGALSREHVIGWVTDPLEAAGIADYNLWWIDVPEFLRTPEELHARLVGSQDPPPPPYPDVADVFEKVFRQHAGTGGVTIRHQRLLWRASLP